VQKIDKLPIWLFFVTVLVVSLFWTECGYRMGEWLRPNASQELPHLGIVVTSVLNLLAFMLGFTFNIAVSRFDDRRAAILGEAIAIDTTYSRADLFNEPHKGHFKKLLREYVQLRAHVILPDHVIAKTIAQSEAIHDELWSGATTLGREHQSSPVFALFISSLNQIVEMHAKRIALGLHSRVPLPVWMVLFAVSGLAGGRSWVETFLLIVAFGLVMAVVIDLERPIKGLIKTGQHPMLDLAKKLGPP
jgi:hypothetical protein